jgi:hypothetical protein
MSLEVLVGNQSTSCNQARKEKKMKNVSSRHILLASSIWEATRKRLQHQDLQPSSSPPPPRTSPFNSTFYGHLRCRSSLFPALAAQVSPCCCCCTDFFASFLFLVASLLPFWLHAALLPVAASNNLLHNNQKMTTAGYLVCRSPDNDRSLSAGIRATGRMVKPPPVASRHFSRRQR